MIKGEELVSIIISTYNCGKIIEQNSRSKKKQDYNDLLKFCPGNLTIVYDVQILGELNVPDIKKRNDYVLW